MANGRDTSFAGLAARFWGGVDLDWATGNGFEPLNPYAVPQPVSRSSGSRIGVGVSGGADSMGLLRLLAGPERPDWAPEVVAMHVHHGLRGVSADRDMDFARHLAGDLGVAFRYRRLEGERLRRAAGGSLEASARRARYGAFRAMARAAGCGAVALAHHEDDLAETLLIRLMRGSGLSGLGGFGRVGWVEGVCVLRPLVSWSREEVRRVAELAGIAWGEDETNRDTAMLRNRVRHELLPCFERVTDHPPVSRMLARTARLLAREARIVESVARRVYGEVRCERAKPRRVGFSVGALDGEGWESLPYLLRMLAMDALRSAYPPSQARVEELERFARAPRSDAILQSERNLVAWMDRDGVLWLYRKTRRRMARAELLKIFRG